jgi:hypothetical protein
MPVVDRHAFEVLPSHTFTASDFVVLAAILKALLETTRRSVGFGLGVPRRNPQC